ncbi:MAG: hypothetical protein OXC62_02625, partial [Aestuariivita sp.]|nr:hypothetical protein [Aestuariivita sp.]
GQERPSLRCELRGVSAGTTTARTGCRCWMTWPRRLLLGGLLLCGVSLAAHPVPRRRAWLSVTLWMRAPPMWLLLSSVSGLPEPGSAQPVLILRRLRRCMTPRRTSLPGRIGLLWCGVTLPLPGSLRPSGSPGSPARRAHCCGCPTVTPLSGETITAA